jgi:hypothetical protein
VRLGAFRHGNGTYQRGLLRWLVRRWTGRQLNRELARCDGTCETVARFNRQTEFAVRNFYVDPRHHILTAELREFEAFDFVQEKSDNNMLRENEVATRVCLIRHLPCRDNQGRRSAAVRVEAHDFGVVKARPVAEPIEKLPRSLNCGEFWRQFHQGGIMPYEQRLIWPTGPRRVISNNDARTS